MIQIEFFNRLDIATREDHVDDTYIKVGPLNSFQWTYSHLRLQTNDMDYDLPRYEKECVQYNGMFFGDFRICPYNPADKSIQPLKTN